LGLTLANPQARDAAIRSLVASEPASEDGRNEYGTFWRVEGLLTGPERGGSGRDDLASVARGWSVPIHHLETSAGVTMGKKVFERVVLDRTERGIGYAQATSRIWWTTCPIPRVASAAACSKSSTPWGNRSPR